MRCINCPDFVPTGINIENSLGYCRIDAIPGSINPYSLNDCPVPPINSKIVNKLTVPNSMGVNKL